MIIPDTLDPRSDYAIRLRLIVKDPLVSEPTLQAFRASFADEADVHILPTILRKADGSRILHFSYPKAWLAQIVDLRAARFFTNYTIKEL